MMKESVANAKFPWVYEAVGRTPLNKFRMAAHHVWIIGAVALMTLLFLGKAIHIDDPLFVYEAEQILLDPVHPYDFQINWLGRGGDAVYSIPNPPLVSYWYALFMALFGGSEKVLHGCMAVFPLMAAYSMFFLAKRFTGRPLPATLVLILSPSFFVSATTLMVDFPAMAAGLAAAALFIHGLDSENRRVLFVSGVVLAAACLIKYWTVLHFGFLAFYAWHRGRLREALGPLGLAAGIFGGWVAFTLWTSGFIHPLVGRELVAVLEISAGRKLVSLLSFTGVSLFLIGCFLWNTSRRDYFIPGLALVAAMLGLLRFKELGPEMSILFFLLAFNGAYLLLRALSGWLDRGILQDRDSFFLLVWLTGGLAFVLLGTHFNAMRFILVFLPPLVLYLFREGGSAPRFEKRFIPNLIAMGVVGFGISLGDFHLANAYRESVPRIFAEIRTVEFGSQETRDSESTVWFPGHWGFQFYMEKAGARNLDFENARELRPGDWVIDTREGHKNFLPQKIRSRLRPVKVFQANSVWPVRIMNRSLGAGWYADIWGPLPFALDRTAPLETFTLYRVVTPDRVGRPHAE